MTVTGLSTLSCLNFAAAFAFNAIAGGRDLETETIAEAELTSRSWMQSKEDVDEALAQLALLGEVFNTDVEKGIFSS